MHGNEEHTMVVALFCFAQCIVELLAVERLVPAISDTFRIFLFCAVALNFGVAYAGTGSSMPTKAKPALFGFAVYTMHSLGCLALGDAMETSDELV